MADVFLSYQRSDAKMASEIAFRLEKRGFSVFFDQTIRVGDLWDVKIESELDVAGAVVVLWSATSVLSKWVRIEARVGAERGILCPAKIGECELPLEFSSFQAADLRSDIGLDLAGQGMARLHASIVEVLADPHSLISSPSIFRRADGSLYLQIGKMYLEGDGAPQSRDLALVWFRKAASRGSEEAAGIIRRLGSHVLL